MSRRDAVAAAEAQVAACLLSYPALVAELPGLTPEAWLDPVWRDVVAEAQQLQADGTPRTPEEALAAILTRLIAAGNGHGPAIHERLLDLWQSYPASASYARAYWPQVANAHAARRLLLLMADLRDRVTREGADEPLGEWIALVGERVSGFVEAHLDATSGLPGGVAGEELVARRVAAMEDCLASGAAPGLLTGWPALDRHLVGFRPGDLAVVAARPGQGKTAFCVSLVGRMMLRGERPNVAFISLEQSEAQIGDRLLATLSGVPLRQIQGREPWDDGIEQPLVGALQAITGAPLVVYEPARRAAVADVAAIAHRHQHRHGLDLLIVDHLLQLRSEARYRERRDAVSEDVRALKALAQSLGVPILLATQIVRPPKTGKAKPPALHDLKESGTIEEVADVVLLLHRPRHDQPEGDDEIKVQVAKQRDGETGGASLRWIGRCTRIEEPT